MSVNSYPAGYHMQFRNDQDPNLRNALKKNSKTPLHSHTAPSHNPTANPNTAAPTAIPTPAVTIGTPPVLTVLALGASAAATCNPYAVVVTALPLIVVVTTLVAVVDAEHPLHVVHGAAVLHGPAVQPGQSDDGHALPSHHAVHGPLRQSDFVDQSLQGPQLEEPQGPTPEEPVS